ncbi:Uncharacterised protein [uncultured Roseburia sp.]|uniref:Phloretin hydrolase n=1 Tax=Brotonthovivens ammoniilytica TaxID=2981725 RepID=A0ABT2TFE3_9FIRM|nr:phloretin hydrolase [Brotonthovivens ammoniilytica]MCU6760899.1 phloretin hydrolase [Brotonthovivens ammoniilytica]SCI12702.1 Uncharacterised protein [uncultured Roseburia sp.]
MDNMQKSKVLVSEEDQQKSYFKYYLQELAQAEPEHYERFLKAPISPEQALAFSDRNGLFENMEEKAEIGYCIMPDGTGYIANLTKMPGVTTEMIDWWFAWHGLDNLRYKIWDPEDHYKAETQNKVRALDLSLSYRERLWDTTHEITEDTGMGPDNIVINFKYPGDVGYDVSKIGTKACSTLIVGKGFGKGQPPLATIPTIMTHFVREVEGGIELRSRFWMGWTYENGRDVKILPEGMRVPPMGPMSLGAHCIKEFTNLAAILPQVYAEEKDNF